MPCNYLYFFPNVLYSLPRNISYNKNGTSQCPRHIKMGRHTNMVAMVRFSIMSGSVTVKRQPMFDPHVLLCPLCLQTPHYFTICHPSRGGPCVNEQFWSQVFTQSFVSFCVPDSAHVIKGTDRPTWAFLFILCEIFLRTAVMSRILNDLLEYERLLP